MGAFTSIMTTVELSREVDAERRPMTPRESALLRGLVDWVALDRIHWDVAQANRGAPMSVVQTRTLELIRSLVNEGLFELGDLSGPQGQFAAWDSPIDESINRIQDVYVANFEAQNVWPWYCWLNLTEKGTRLAQQIKSKSESPLDS
jgi:hypothetical protein